MRSKQVLTRTDLNKNDLIISLPTVPQMPHNACPMHFSGCIVQFLCEIRSLRGSRHQRLDSVRQVRTLLLYIYQCTGSTTAQGEKVVK